MREQACEYLLKVTLMSNNCHITKAVDYRTIPYELTLRDKQAHAVYKLL